LPTAGWSMPYFDPSTLGLAIGDIMAATEALLFGRRNWQSMAAAWPDRAGDPFADRMNTIPKYVALRTLSRADLSRAGSTLLPARELRARDGEGLQVMGSPSLAAQLVTHGLVDEYRLTIEPILLGGGKRLFPDDGAACPLQLVSATTTATGALICTYRPVDR
jgi:dihydrofolate reductase